MINIMKYTSRHVKKYLEEGKIVPECSECEDKKNDLCQGGKNPVDCFLGIYAESEAAKISDNDRKARKDKSKKFFPDAKGKKSKVPAGANISFDQSKM